MSSLSFPDINVWLALLVEDHRHRSPALAWWRADLSGRIAFSRPTQIGVLRFLTTAAAMNDRPLTMAEAWSAHDHLYLDDRVVFLPEPSAIERGFRQAARFSRASPKLWADAYLAAFADVAGAELVTFDQALAKRSKRSRLLA